MNCFRAALSGRTADLSARLAARLATRLAAGLALWLGASLAVAAPAGAAENTGWSTLTRITSNAQWAAGQSYGTAGRRGSLRIDHTFARMTRQGISYGYATWYSAWVSPGRRFTRLVPSWTAQTPAGTWLQVFVRVRTADGRVSAFKNLGNWSTDDYAFRRSSAGAQEDGIARVATDTLVSTGPVLTRYQYRVRLLRQDGRDGRRAVSGTPVVRSLQSVVSRLPSSYPGTSTPLEKSAVLLRVPQYSQMIHEGQNPQYGGGGEAWCSPTSLAMVVSWYGKRPAASTYRWVPLSWKDRFVNHVARKTYDYRYQGTGNWPFNTGLAAAWVGDTFVTRLPDLRAAERFVRAGIPVVASIAFDSGELKNAPLSSTDGHLVVIVGFTRYGNPIVNDPAARSDDTVRRTYWRGQFERAWLNGSGGLSYIVRDTAHPLPARPAGMHAW